MMSNRFRNSFRAIIASVVCCMSRSAGTNPESTWFRMYPRMTSQNSSEIDYDVTKGQTMSLATSKFHNRKRSARVLDMHDVQTTKLTCVRYNQDNCDCHHLVLKTSTKENGCKHHCNN